MRLSQVGARLVHVSLASSQRRKPRGHREPFLVAGVQRTQVPLPVLRPASFLPIVVLSIPHSPGHLAYFPANEMEPLTSDCTRDKTPAEIVVPAVDCSVHNHCRGSAIAVVARVSDRERRFLDTRAEVHREVTSPRARFQNTVSTTPCYVEVIFCVRRPPRKAATLRDGDHFGLSTKPALVPYFWPML